MKSNQINMSEHDIFIMRLYSSAVSWNHLSQLLVEAEKIDHSLRIALNSVLVLATELSIKTILAISGHCEKCICSSGHKLSELFKKIGDDNLRAISNGFEAAYKANIGQEIDFIEMLKKHDDCFTEWRYMTFVKDLDSLQDNFDYTFMTNCQRVTAQQMEVIHKLYLEAANETQK